MLAQGVYLPPSAFESWFVSTAHDERAVERIADALPAAARAAAEATAHEHQRQTARPATSPSCTSCGTARSHNPDGVLYGRLPGYHLSELGRQMADRVAEHLADRDITHVVASPLERAQETAAPIAKAHGLDLATDPRLIEAANVFEGKTFGVGDGALRSPRTGSYLTNPFKPSWGEPYVDQVVG